MGTLSETLTPDTVAIFFGHMPFSHVQRFLLLSFELGFR
jgi:hypothetical protein